jgi:hypothetical protein
LAGVVADQRPIPSPSTPTVRHLEYDMHIHSTSARSIDRGAAVAAVLAFGVLVWSEPASACSVCGCGDPLLAANDPAAITGKLRLQLDTEYLRIDAGTDGVAGSTDQLTQWSYRFNAVWRPLEDLALTATLPYVQKTIRAVTATSSELASEEEGLGDVEVGARYGVWRSVQVGERRVQELAISAGTSLPTGAHDAKDATGGLVDPHGQLGTGGWGPFAGLHYRLEQGDWSAFASVSYRLRTEASYFDGTRYKFGNAFLWSFHGQYQPHRAVALDLGLDGRYAVADRQVDAGGAVTDPVGNTGGTVLSAAPGVYLNAVGGLWLFVRAQLPFYKHLLGEQDVKPSVTAGLQFQVL